MEKRQNCFNYMFHKCTNNKCPYGHVILDNKENYLRKLKEFDIEVLERTSQTYGLIFVLKSLNTHRDKEVGPSDVDAVGEILEKFANSGTPFFSVKNPNQETKENSDYEDEANIDTFDEAEFNAYENEIKYSLMEGGRLVDTYPRKNIN